MNIVNKILGRHRFHILRYKSKLSNCILWHLIPRKCACRSLPAYKTLIVKTILSQHDAQGKDGGQFLDSDDIGKDSQDNLHVTDVGSLNRILTGIAII